MIVAALMLLGADAVTSLEKGGEITVRSLGADLGHARSGVAGRFQGLGAASCCPSWRRPSIPRWRCPAGALTGVIGVTLAFIFGRKHGTGIIGAFLSRCDRWRCRRSRECSTC